MFHVNTHLGFLGVAFGIASLLAPYPIAGTPPEGSPAMSPVCKGSAAGEPSGCVLVESAHCPGRTPIRLAVDKGLLLT